MSQVETSIYFTHFLLVPTDLSNKLHFVVLSQMRESGTG